MRTLFNNGLASDEDIAEADTQLASAEAQATDLGVARAQYEHAIATLIGVAPANFSLPYRHLQQALPVVPVGVPDVYKRQASTGRRRAIRSAPTIRSPPAPITRNWC